MMGLPVGRVSPGQRRMIRRRLDPLREREGTLIRQLGAGVANKAPVTISQHVAYRRGAISPGSLSQEPGVFELVRTLYVQFSVDEDVQPRDLLIDNADGMRLGIQGIVPDTERRGSKLGIAQVNT